MDADSADSANPAAATAPTPSAYCRRCGYSLRGLVGGQCPECGAAFDLSNRKTFARRPPRARLRRWAWRVAAVAALLALAAASVPGWYWWQWHREQRPLDEARRLGGNILVQRVEPTGLGRYLPARWGYLHDRAYTVNLYNRSADEVARIDFAAFTELRMLTLSGCQLTDAALARLGSSARLFWLDVSDNPLDGSGLAHFERCREISWLRVGSTRLDDAGLAIVGRFPALHNLSIGGTRVTDSGLASLDRQKALVGLNVSDTAVTPAGLNRLRGLKALRTVSAKQIPMTTRDEAELHELMPNVRFSN